MRSAMEKKKSISTGVTGGFVNITRTCNTHTHSFSTHAHTSFFWLFLWRVVKRTLNTAHITNMSWSFRVLKSGKLVIASLGVPYHLVYPHPAHLKCYVKCNENYCLLDTTWELRANIARRHTLKINPHLIVWELLYMFKYRPFYPLYIKGEE